MLAHSCGCDQQILLVLNIFQALILIIYYKEIIYACGVYVYFQCLWNSRYRQ